MATIGTVEKIRNLLQVQNAALAATGDITPFMKPSGPFLRVSANGTWVGTITLLARPAGNGGPTMAIGTYTDTTVPAGKSWPVDCPSADLEYALEFTARTSGTVSASLMGNATAKTYGTAKAPKKKATKKKGR